MVETLLDDNIENIDEEDAMDSCDECARSVYIEDLQPCPACKLYLCDYCQDEHICEEEYEIRDRDLSFDY